MLSAVSFAYGSPYFFHIYPGHLSILSTVAWLPLVFMGLEAFLRHKELKYALLSGIPLSIQVLAGHPQYVFYSTLAASLYFLFAILLRRELSELPYFVAGLALFLIFGLSLSGIQLLPTLELVRYSVREALSYEWVSAFSLPPEKIITLVVPDFFGNLVDAPYWGKNYLWEMSIYLGVIPLCLAIVGLTLDRRKPAIVFALIAAISLLLALGKYTPVLIVLYNYLPGFNLFRGLSKFAFIFGFACSILAGYGLMRLVDLARRGSPSLRYYGYSFLAASLLLVLCGFGLWFYGQEPWRSLIEFYARGPDRYETLPPLTEAFFDSSRGAAARSLLKTGILLGLLGGIWLLSGKIKRMSANFLVASIVALAVMDLWDFGARYLVTFDTREVYMDKELKTFLKSDPEPFRIATPLVPLLNVGLLEGIENVGGYDTIVLKTHSDFVNVSQGLPIDRPNIAMQILATSPMLDLLNVKYYVLDSGLDSEHSDFERVFQNGSYYVYRSKNVLPRSFLVHDAWVVKEKASMLRTLSSPSFNPSAYAVVEESIGDLPHNPNIRSPIPKIRRYSLSEVLIEAHANEPGLLILSDVYYPGWKAFINGKETKVYRANYTMRAVFLPQGRHLVEFRYDPLSFKIGALISLTALVGAGAMGYLRARRPQ
jgi:hypothetical protein